MLTMEQRDDIKYLDTNTATVKMSSGVPFTAGLSLDSESDEEAQNQTPQPQHDDVKNKHVYKENNNVINVKNSILNQHNGIVCNDDLHLDHSLKGNDKSATAYGHEAHITFNDSDFNFSLSGMIGMANSNSKKPTINSVTVSQTSASSHQSHVFIPKGYYWSTKNGSSNLQYDSKKVSEVTVDSQKEQCVSSNPSVSSKEKRSKVQHTHLAGSSSGNPFSPAQNSLQTSDEQTDKRVKIKRMNPFNKYSDFDLQVDEDYFSESQENYFKKHSSCSSTKSSSYTKDDADESDVTFAELGLSEDHFSHPQGHFGLSCSEELEMAIENCKEMIRETSPGSDKQKNLIMKLVQLRIKLQEVKEGPELVPENVKVILSHKMVLKTSRTSKYYCEKCNGIIWGMMQAWYRCTDCGYRCHEKCLQLILRTCAQAKVLEDPTFIMDIAPKDPQGLMSQNYRCWECRSPISFKIVGVEPRLCDYTGRYFCELCHWNDTFVTPSRVLHNWDFTPHKICRASKQFLKLMQKKAVLRIQDINPMLFVYVDQLNEIKKLREEMMIMKKYILSCSSAMSAKLLLLLEHRQHFVESSDRYSMQDLLDCEDVLLPELVRIHSTWAQHIKVECQLCQGHGYFCKLCDAEEVLFPFDNIAVVCPSCCSVYHRHCFAKKFVCLQCERLEKHKTEKP